MGHFGVIFGGRNRGGNRGGNRDGRGDFPGEIFRGGGEEFGRHRKRCRPHEGGRVLSKFRGGLLRESEYILSHFFICIALSKGSLLAMTTGVGLTRERDLEKILKSYNDDRCHPLLSRR